MHTSHQAELALVQAAQAGDKLAFNRLLLSNRSAMRAVIHKMMHKKFDEFQVDEVLAAAQARVWRALASFNGNSKFSTWCYRIAINCALTAIRDSRKRYAECSLSGDADDDGQPAAHEADMTERTEQRHTIAAIGELLETLEMCDPEAHKVFCRNRIDGDPLIRIAAELGITRAKARAHVRFVDTYLRENVAQ